MKKDFMRWTVGLLAGTALVVAGCGSGNESGEGGRETGAFRTPIQEQQQPSADREAEPLAKDRPSHPSANSQKAPAGNLPRGTPLGGGTAGPNSSMRQEAAGLLPRDMGEGLGANLADVYQAPNPPPDAAMGGAGAAGQSQAGSASPAGAAGSGMGAGGSGGGSAGTGGGAGGTGTGGGGSGNEGSGGSGGSGAQGSGGTGGSGADSAGGSGGSGAGSTGGQ
jgi:hypothetical protein